MLSGGMDPRNFFHFLLVQKLGKIVQILDIYLFFRFFSKNRTIFLRFSRRVQIFFKKYFFTFSTIDGAKCVGIGSNWYQTMRLNLGIPKMYNMTHLSWKLWLQGVHRATNPPKYCYFSCFLQIFSNLLELEKRKLDHFWSISPGGSDGALGFDLKVIWRS